MSQSSSGGVERTNDAALAQAGEGDCVGGLGCGLEGADGGAHEGARHALARPHRQQRQAPQVVPLLAGPAAELACSSGDCASAKLSAVRLVRAERRPEMLRCCPTSLPVDWHCGSSCHGCAEEGMAPFRKVVHNWRPRRLSAVSTAATVSLPSPVLLADAIITALIVR